MQVIAKERGFYGCLREPNEEFPFNGKKPARWMEPVNPVDKEDTSLPDAGGTATGGIEAYHVGAGRWAIRQVGGERVGDWVGTREEAESKAAGMNAVDPDLADKEDTSLPDA